MLLSYTKLVSNFIRYIQSLFEMTKSTAVPSIISFSKSAPIVISFHLRNNHEVHMRYPLAKRTSIYLRGMENCINRLAVFFTKD